MRRSLKAVLLIFVFVLPFNLSFRTKVNRQTPYHCKLQLVISANDDLKAPIESYLGRSLRTIGDVTIVDSKPDIWVSVVALKVRAGGTDTGYAITFAVTEPGLPVFLKTLAKDEKSGELLVSLYGDSSTFLDHQLFVGPMDSLKSLCEDTAIAIDSGSINPRRKMWNEDNLKPKKAKPE